MGSEWDEIKRLAADFQKIQLSSTLQKLSERNCVEIVALLSEKGLLDIIFTTDGKEYITPEHLEREINDELYVHDGRVNLVELSKILNVDLSKIEVAANSIAAKDKSVHYTLGQLISEDYISRIAVEINEKLAQSGEMSISDLTILFDLPSDFLQHHVVEKHIGRTIRGRQYPSNPRIIYTQSYILRCKSKIRGALAGITRPIAISTILQQIKIHERIFHSIIDEISPPGTVVTKTSQYIPNIYAKSQTDWVNSFYSQNGYLEYVAISQLGISDTKQFIKKQFPNEKILFLKRFAVGPKLTDLTVVTAIQECGSTNSYVDLSTILPSVMTEEDIDELYNNLISPTTQNNFVFLDGVVFSKEYLNELMGLCRETVVANAKQSVDAGKFQQYLAEKQLSTNKSSVADTESMEKMDKREERRKKASHGKVGGGTQGRETKTKSTKKHARGGDKSFKNSDDEDQPQKKNKLTPLELLSSEEIEKAIFDKLEDEGLSHLVERIASTFYPSLNQLALNTAQTLYEASSHTQRRQTHAALQEKLNILFVDMRLYERGLKVFNADVQQQLLKYLLKTLGTDICNEVFLYVASECNLNAKSTNLNSDQRDKICLECSPEYKSALIELNKSISGASVDDFLTAAENAIKDCGMIIKKIDKKKDKALIVEHKEKLHQQLSEASDPAIILHLVALKLFTVATNLILHASGRHVSHILQYLQPSLSKEQNDVLLKFHDLVLKVLNKNEEDDTSASEELETVQKEVVDMALKFEKQAA
uniref:E3 UFM1-protein ligase 1 homolog n=1 Tax=Tabanus bromius TaxID=304241 RepID=A0A0K8TMS3_TABBR